jgi:hypothetical protein
MNKTEQLLIINNDILIVVIHTYVCHTANLVYNLSKSYNNCILYDSCHTSCMTGVLQW